MKKNFASITAVGSYLPENVLNNFDLEKMVDTNDQWILTRTGIKERRILDKGIGTSFMAINAANQIINKNNINRLKLLNCKGFSGISWIKKNGLKNIRPFLNNLSTN